MDTRQAAAYWRSQDATLHPAQIATRIGKSERTVRQHLQATAGYVLTESAVAVDASRRG